MASPGPKDKHRQLAALQNHLSSEDDYRDLFENASDIVYTHDLNGVLTSINKAAERITGYTREETLGTSVFQWLDAESRGVASEMIQQQLGGALQITYEVTLIAKDGRPVALEVGTRLVFRDGVPVGVQGIARDITERRKAEILEQDRNRVLELVAGNAAARRCTGGALSPGRAAVERRPLFDPAHAWRRFCARCGAQPASRASGQRGESGCGELPQASAGRGGRPRPGGLPAPVPRGQASRSGGTEGCSRPRSVWPWSPSSTGSLPTSWRTRRCMMP